MVTRRLDMSRTIFDLNVTDEPPRTSISRTPYASDLSNSLDQPLDLSNPHDHQTSTASFLSRIIHESQLRATLLWRQSYEKIKEEKAKRRRRLSRFTDERSRYDRVSDESSRTPHASDLSNSLHPSYPSYSRTSSAVSPSFSSQFADPTTFSSFAPPVSISTHSPPPQLSSLSLNPVTHVDHVPPETILSSISNGSSPPDEDDESSLENTVCGRAPKGSVRGRLGSTGRGRARKKEVLPDDRDENYYEKRQRNNAAAQKSREKKKREEMLTKYYLVQERERNDSLEKQNEELRVENIQLRQLLFIQVHNASSTALNNDRNISP